MAPSPSPLSAWRWGIVSVALAIIFMLGTGHNFAFRIVTGVAGCALLVEPLARLHPGRLYRQDRAQSWLLIALAVLFAVQLYPLDPALWSALPGRGLFATGDYLMFGEVMMRPMTLDPDATVTCLAFLIPALGALLWARTDKSFWAVLALIFVGMLGVSLLLEIAQVAMGPGRLRLYHDTVLQPPAGLFGNRNHQAVAMACGIPLVAALIADDRRIALIHRSLREAQMQRLAFGIVTACFGLGALLTASRAGCLLLLPAIWAGWAILPQQPARDVPPPLRRYLPWLGVALGAILLVLLVVARWSPGGPLGQLFHRSLFDADARYRYWPTVIDAIWKYAPFGSGFGTFAEVFEMEEPIGLLSPLYVAYAHNDWLQITLEGGAVAVLLALLFVAWWLRRSIDVWRHGIGALPQAATVVVALLLAHSCVDFPLRGTALSTLFGGCCGILAATARRGRSA